jgi:hypothetical protein
MATARVLQKRLATTTRKTYASGIKAWTDFCDHITGEDPVFHELQRAGTEDDVYAVARVIEPRLLRFATFLFAKELSFSTVSGYLSAVKAAQFDWVGVPVTAVEQAMFKLPMLMKAIKRQRPPLIRQRAPVTVEMLLVVADDVHNQRGRFTLDILAALATAFQALLRVSEYTAPLANGLSRLLWNQVVFFEGESKVNMQKLGTASVSRVEINLGSTKADQLARNAPVAIPWANSPISACDLLVRLVKSKKRWQLAPLQPVFMFNGHAMIPSNITKAIKVLISTYFKALEPAQYSTHSLRIGGMVALQAAGASQLQAMTLGRWNSDCYRVYQRQNRKEAEGLLSKMLRTQAVVVTAANGHVEFAQDFEHDFE